MDGYQDKGLVKDKKSCHNGYFGGIEYARLFN
jgi:hypothetical protein